MKFKLRDLDPTGKLVSQLRLDLLARIIPQAEIDAVFADLGLRTQRIRKVTLEATVWLVITMSLYADRAITEVFAELAHGLRLLWPDDAERLTVLPGNSALVKRRQQLGAKPLQELFARVARPLAVPPTATSGGTPGAFFHGLRWVAIDGHVQDVADTPLNVRAFGRPKGSRGDSAFPQVRCLSFCECGTHAMLAAEFVSSKEGEDRAACCLLRALEPGHLLTVDAGLYSYELLVAVRQKGAHALFRLPATVQIHGGQRLADGSCLVRLTPSDRTRRRHGEHQWVRIIAYTIQDPQCPGFGTNYRLVTTLLNSPRYPAAELAAGYHMRWEVELTIDEQDTHQLQQHHPSSPLRSQTPDGVRQELYGLFLMHYILRALIYTAALEQDQDPLRVSFTHALHVVQRSLADFEIAAAELLPGLFRRLLQDLLQPLLPPRAPRYEPRVVKRKVIKWLLKQWDDRLRPMLERPFVEAIQIFGQPVAALK